jgi:hypothetical protein
MTFHDYEIRFAVLESSQLREARNIREVDPQNGTKKEVRTGEFWILGRSKNEEIFPSRQRK